jgi:hypothetical protein
MDSATDPTTTKDLLDDVLPISESKKGHFLPKCFTNVLNAQFEFTKKERKKERFLY